MEIEFLTKRKYELKMAVTGESHTLFNMLKSELLSRKEVESCGYRQEHPLIDKTIFLLFTKGKSAKSVLNSAMTKLKKDLTRLGRSFK